MAPGLIVDHPPEDPHAEHSHPDSHAENPRPGPSQKKYEFPTVPDFPEDRRDFVLNGDVLPFLPRQHEPLHLEAAEHKATARDVDLFDINGQKLSVDAPLVEVPTNDRPVPLTFGDIIALGGDFYTNREGATQYYPIVDADHFGSNLSNGNAKSSKSIEARFDCAVDSLLSDADGYLSMIYKTLEHEHHAVAHGSKTGDSVARAYHEHARYIDDNNQPCSIPTDDDFRNASKTWMMPFIPMYVWIAYTNIDHFGDDAVTAYSVGHTRALSIARSVHNEPNDVAKMKKLRLAYIYEAFAAHYLTDLFSSGHLRAPRRSFHSNDYVQLKAAHSADIAIWDFQCRYMHDDDSATGLLVCNSNGEQWVEYGDKQFFEPQAVVNRARCMDTLQQSALEVYQVGYSSTRNIGAWKKNQDWFVALKLIPQPMTSARPQDWLAKWGGYDMHNPAPLWVAPTNTPNVGDGWTVRKDINDHSNFQARVDSTPKNTGSTFSISVSKEVGAIQKASFCGDDQFPLQTEMKRLLSGGFVQVQDLNAGLPGKGTCVNFWSPVSVKILGKDYYTFTLRNRLIDQDIVPAPGAGVRHWMRGPEIQDRLSLAAFSWSKKAGDRGDIVTQWSSYNLAHLGSNAPADGTCASLNMRSSWAMGFTAGSVSRAILEDLPHQGCANLTRFAKGRFLPAQEEYSRLDVLAIAQLKNQKAKVGIISDAFEYPAIAQNEINGLAAGAPYGFAKTFRGANSTTDSIVLARGRPTKGTMAINIAKVDFDSAGKPKFRDWPFQFKCTIATEDSCILIGDALGLGYDQTIVLALDSDGVNFGTYGSPSKQDTDFKLLGMHKSSFSQEVALASPLLTALVPTSTANPGLDILYVSLHKSGAEMYLSFRTFSRAAPQPGVPGEDARPYGPRCKEPPLIRDDLASRSMVHYFSIKWMPVRYQTDDGTACRGIMEVYSWYGVLGVRLFGAGKTGWKYELLGQLPYLGQTSIGAGLGAYGNWDHGFVAWGGGDEFIDVNLFNPKNKEDMLSGSWGMSWDDLERKQVRGWEVEGRPLR